MALDGLAAKSTGERLRILEILKLRSAGCAVPGILGIAHNIYLTREKAWKTREIYSRIFAPHNEQDFLFQARAKTVHQFHNAPDMRIRVLAQAPENLRAVF